jgi:4-hydroxybenzoate polyprenyltransferase
VDTTSASAIATKLSDAGAFVEDRKGIARVAEALTAAVVAVRPRQWIKNGLLFVPLVFTLDLFDRELLFRTTEAFFLFCALASAGYLLNDAADVGADRRHPTKRLRPIAAGKIPVPVAVVLGVVLGTAGAAGAWAISPALGELAVIYLLITVVYTKWLKHMVLLDVFGLSAGFVIRAAAGAAVIGVPISPWLYTATMLGALLIGLGKRRSELKVLGPGAGLHRRNLGAYTVEFVDNLILIISAAAVMTYALYTFSADNLPKDHSMMLTLPVVLYGLFRYLFLIRSTEIASAPEELLIRDTPLLASVAVWAGLAVTILYAAAR